MILTARQSFLTMGLLAAMGSCGVAQAQKAGDWVLGVGVAEMMPQDSSEPMRVTSVRGVPTNRAIPGTASSVSDATTLGLSLTRFLTDNWAIEGVAGVPPEFKLYGEQGLKSVGTLGTAKLWSPAILGKYYFGRADSPFRVSAGLGVSYIWFSDVALTRNMQTALGTRLTGSPVAGAMSTTSATLSSSFTPVLNVGADYAFNKNWGIGLSVSYLPLKTKAKLSTNFRGAEIATTETRVTLNPIVTTLKVNYRF